MMNTTIMNVQTSYLIKHLTHWVSRYVMDYTIERAHGSVATLWNGTTIPHRCALPCTRSTAHSITSNYGFQV